MVERNWQAFPVKEQIHISELYTLFQVHHREGYEFSGETHNFWECVYVLQGELRVTADERVYHLSVGEMIFHKPLELHKFVVQSQGGALLLIFSFSAVGPLCGWLRDKVFGLTREQQTLLEHMLDYIAAQEAAEMPELPEYSYLTPYTHIPGYLQNVVMYLQQLFLSFTGEEVVSQVSSAPDAVIFGKVIGYLNSNLSRQPSVSEIARFANVSTASLKRIFSKYTGMGIHKYLLKLKIKAAMELLQDGESVNVVAEKVGFNSQSYFSKAFKRETGVNPSEVR